MSEEIVDATEERPLEVLPAAATAAARRQRRATQAVWTVQVRRELELDETEPDSEEPKFVGYVFWEDIATVKVPPSTKRRRVFELALEQAGIKAQVGVVPPTMRALDADSAHEVTPEVDVQLKIG